MNKAQVFSISSMLEILISGVFAALVGWLLLGGHASITQMSIEYANERHSLTLANIFDSRPDIAYFDGYQYHRDVLNKTNLDNLMTTRQDFVNNWKTKIYPDSKLSENFSYPDSFAVIIVLDLEKGSGGKYDGWITTLSETNKTFSLDDFLNCLKEKINTNDIPNLFTLNSNLHEIFKLEDCKVPMYSKILDYGFPVAIEYQYDDVHAGLIKVLVIEW